MADIHLSWSLLSLFTYYGPSSLPDPCHATDELLELCHVVAQDINSSGYEGTRQVSYALYTILEPDHRDLP